MYIIKLMSKREQDAAAKIDRYLSNRWTLTELAVILEPMSFRTLTSWISGQTLRIHPSVWTAGQVKAAGGTNVSVQFHKRAKYGFPNLLQCLMARTLFDAGVDRAIVQQYIESGFPGPQSNDQLMNGYFLILTGTTPQTSYFFPDKPTLIESIANSPAPLPQCAIFNFAPILSEAIGRLNAWEERRAYVPKSQDDVLAEAQRAWVEAGAERLSAKTAALRRAMQRHQQRGGVK